MFTKVVLKVVFVITRVCTAMDLCRFVGKGLRQKVCPKGKNAKDKVHNNRHGPERQRPRPNYPGGRVLRIHFELLRFHFDCTSSSLQFHFEFNSISFRMDFQSWGARPRPPRPSHLHGGAPAPPHPPSLYVGLWASRPEFY